ncbi:hypothetical protein L9F63_004147 [Diploptera punctata]|uniref:DUF4485 domain-containing protein n=1 Tax=Diploptera punctata TaxID=6984 RepID=A0AAD7ZGB2_DIPPU|nr:hypothetical protein L9F63_004147 [Diploptera punctata]
MADMYDEEFHRYLSLAKKLVSKLKDRNDMVICKRWIAKLSSLQSDDLMVKKNRNYFFKYMLHVMHDGVLEGPFQELPTDDKLHGAQEQEKMQCLCGGIQPGIEDECAQEIPNYLMHWSQDGCTYIAAKPLPNCGALIYMAVAKDPTLGWDMPVKTKTLCPE